MSIEQVYRSGLENAPKSCITRHPEVAGNPGQNPLEPDLPDTELFTTPASDSSDVGLKLTSATSSRSARPTTLTMNCRRPVNFRLTNLGPLHAIRAINSTFLSDSSPMLPTAIIPPTRLTPAHIADRQYPSPARKPRCQLHNATGTPLTSR